MEDINDNVPKFERDSYSIEFSEDAKIGKDGDTNSGNFTHPPTPCPPLVLFIIKLVQTRSGQYLPEGTSGRFWGPPTHFHHRVIFRCAPFNIFLVIVVNDADMDNNGKVEFSIKQDQPTFGIFSKAGFSSNQNASVSCPIRKQMLDFVTFW